MGSLFSIAVPMQVRALVVDQSAKIAPPPYNYCYGARPGAGQLPFLASAYRNPPMGAHEDVLKPGLHLHWQMPDRLTRGQTEKPDKTTAFVHSNGLYFPCLPNRWWIGRKGKKPGEYEQNWIVESDSTRDSPASPYVSIAVAHRDVPLGRVSEARSSPMGLDGAAKVKLSAIGASDMFANTDLPFADPFFAAFYPNCHSMFGLHDSEFDPVTRGKAEYTVIGWYSDDRLNPLQEWLAKAPEDVRPARQALQAANLVKPDDVGPAALNAARLAAATGWAINSTRQQPAHIICFGEVAVNTAEDVLLPAALPPTAAIGSTPLEAASALLAGGDAKTEMQLFALANHKDFSGKRLDLAPALSRARHYASLNPVDTYPLWAVVAEHAGQTALAADETGRMQRRDESMPPEMAGHLGALNKAEAALFGAQTIRQTAQQMLFAHWHAYASLASATDSAEEAARHRGHLQAMLEEVNAARDSEKQAQGARDTAFDAATACIERCNSDKRPADQLKLLPTPGPRFWRPADPVLAFADTTHHIPSTPASRSASPDMLSCWTCQFDPNWTYHGGSTWQPGAQQNQIFALFEQLETGFKPVTKPFRSALRSQQSRTNWSPIALEWKAAFLPAQLGEGSAQGRLDHTALHNKFAIREGQSEFYNTDGALYRNLPHDRRFEMAGRAFIGEAGQSHLTEAVESYLDQLDAHIAEDPDGDPKPGALEARRVLLATLRKNGSQRTTTATLGGMMERMLGRFAEPQLPVRVPAGREDADLAQQVAKALEDATGLATPEPGAPFAPLASGEIQLEATRIIDLFGRCIDWPPPGEETVVIPAESLSDPGKNRIILPPRSPQAARIDFRWLSATDNDVQSNAHPDSSPICGWLVPSHLDSWILVHAAHGKLLGYVDETKTWQRAPNDPDAPAGPMQFENKHLGEVVACLVNPDPASGVPKIASFLERLDSALGQIAPEHAASYGSRAILLGRPLAVARALAGVTLRGTAAQNMQKEALGQSAEQAAQAGIHQLDVPLYLGDPARMNDGLIGLFNRSANQTRLEFSETWSKSAIVHQSFAAPGAELTLLLDPHCPVHIRSGLLPTKAIDIPRSHYAAGLQAMEALFSAAPVLSPAGHRGMPVPKATGQDWAFLWQTKGRWTETGSARQITKDDLDQAFPGYVVMDADGNPQYQSPQISPQTGLKAVQYLWPQLKAQGWITEAPDGTAARLRPGDERMEIAGFEKADLEMQLAKITRQFGGADHLARFEGRVMAHDGWLRMTPWPDQ